MEKRARTWLSCTLLASFSDNLLEKSTIRHSSSRKMEEDKRVPVTMLSGFLGAGKTTLLRHLLTKTKQKVACIVNDVASINIDSKLIRNSTTTDLTDTLELQNGCACCSIQDELFTSFDRVLHLGSTRGTRYDRIVLENSGIAEPHNIRDAFQEAEDQSHPLMSQIRLDCLVTVVDASTFGDEYASRDPLAARPELGEGGGFRPVVDLLVEQVECSDLIVVNKADLIGAVEMDRLVELLVSLNPLARVLVCSHGGIDVDDVFSPKADATLVAGLNIEGHHRGAVAAARKRIERPGGEGEAAEAAEGSGGEPHKHAKHEDCPACLTGDHHHEHHHHEEGGGHCEEEGCKDPTHNHHHYSHGPKSDRQDTSASRRFGITSFVYSRRRPFHPQRLRDLVYRWLPVTHNRAMDGHQASDGDKGAAAAAPGAASCLQAVIRSKGFVWMSSSHTSAMYWSHAGSHFELRSEGDWWVTVPDEEWPSDARQVQMVLSDFDRQGAWGDRRQEIVFIGREMDEAAIARQLDAALLTEEEMAKYSKQWAELRDPVHPSFEALRAAEEKKEGHGHHEHHHEHGHHEHGHGHGHHAH